MAREPDPLSLFHPVIRAWFSEQVGAPTAVQRRAWPEIADGQHVLVTAPTGSGKTLAAFLWPIHQLLSGAWLPGQVRVVYISPLKALNNDVQRNLIAPLNALRLRWLEAGLTWPDLGVETRSGDTPSSDRQRMLRRPPEFLITTPESLNILVSSPGGRRILHGVAAVILDEIHAVVGSKRGTHLMTAVERLVPLTGEFQRIALSATVRPLEAVADFVGGYELDNRGGSFIHHKRQVRILEAHQPKAYQLEVRLPQDSTLPAPGEDTATFFWKKIALELKAQIRQHRSTLIFGNNRRLVERLVRFINEGEEVELAYAHHGSLAKELRLVVEARLKNGELAAIVATNSLELGIDIGALDQVIMVQTPPSVSSAIQRLGRAGHQVGATSSGLLYPVPGRDLIDAAVVSKMALEADIEPIQPIKGPLDVLSQVLVAMTGVDTWELEELFAFIRCCAPYHDLSRRQFDLVIDMLSGRFADSRLRELTPRISVDRVDNTVSARPGALRLTWQAGGTIPDRGYYTLRMQDTKARIGELDEEFVWERSLGDTFTLGSQTWRIQKITHNDVEVVRTDAPPSIIPFWRAEQLSRGWHLAEQIGLFLERQDDRLEQEGLDQALATAHHMPVETARELITYLQRQRNATGTSLPHRFHLLVEHYTDPLNASGGKQVVLHTLWGGRVNQPYSMALSAAWKRKSGAHLEVFHNNDCILLMLPEAFRAEDLLSAVTPENLHALLREHLASTGLFGAYFRENAARALLLPRAGFNKRMPLWLNRLRSQKLLDAMSRYDDFPIVLETWRACLQDEFDLPTLERLLDEVRTGAIAVGEAYTRSPSPFTEGVIWQMTNKFMYEDDTPTSQGGVPMREDLLKELVHASDLRPRIDPAIVAQLEARLQRTAPGYAPGSAQDLLDWIKERIAIPWPEWQALLAAIERDHEGSSSALIAAVSHRVVRIGGPASPVYGGDAGRSAAAGAHDPPRGRPDGGWGRVGDTAGAWTNESTLVVSLEAVSRLESALDVTLPLEAALPLGGDEALHPDVRTYLSQRPAPAPDPASRSTFLAEWLRYYGPRSPELIAGTFGLTLESVEEAIEPLTDVQTLVAGVLLKDCDALQVCDAENLEVLLRLTRSAARPVFKPLELDRLPLFLAHHQGLTRRGDSIEALQDTLARLFGYPLPAQAWEEWVLPARLAPYHTSWLDTLMQESELLWFGCGKEQVTFAFEEELELFRTPGDHEPAGGDGAEEEADSGAGQLEPQPTGLEAGNAGSGTGPTGLEAGNAGAGAGPSGLEAGNAGSGAGPADSRLTLEDYGLEDVEVGARGGPGAGSSSWSIGSQRHFTFEEARAASSLGSGELTRLLWEKLWAGEITNDSFVTLRKGIEHQFKPPELPQTRPRGRAGSSRAFGRWQTTRPLTGTWQVLPTTAPPDDLIDELERSKDRVRQVLERYGVLFRELLARELPALRWAALFRTLRLMELSGEILAGYFFEGIPGLQFVSHEAFRTLQKPLTDDCVFWLNATDPASCAGVKLPALQAALPRRLASTWLVFHGSRPVLVAKSGGKAVEIAVAPDHPDLPGYLELFKSLLGRQFRPPNVIEIETVNDAPAVSSPYLPAFLAFGFVKEFRTLTLRRRF